jgi:hypothetical protein
LTIKLYFEGKRHFMQRVIDECLDRLLFQSSYLAEVKELLWA